MAGFHIAGAGADALAVSAPEAAGLCDPRMNQPPAIPTNRQMAANT